MWDVALLTEKRYLKLKPGNWYIQNIIQEDILITSELRDLGITCKRVAWDGDFNHSSFKCAVFRTTWNYFDEIDKFLSFLYNYKNCVSFINPYEQIIWNLDKRYLLELEQLGVNIVKTHIVTKNDYVELLKVSKKHNWNDVIIKPCVSAAAWNTHYIKEQNVKENEKLFKSLVSKYDMMIQPFQKNILTRGEISLMMINGKYTHAVLKKAKAGDFRVQDDFGGSVEKYNPQKEEVVFAQSVISAIPFNCLYARIDVVYDNSGRLALSELELIEPEMWFRLNGGSAKKMAHAIKSYILNLN